MLKALKSHVFVPVLFCLLNWKIWSGTHGFIHDTGDGIGAFKFASLLPKYWNWFEAGGQPYWYDLARLQDPVSWLLLAPLKLLPLETFTAYGIFILLRIGVLGVGVSLLVASLGFRWRVRQLATGLVLFGSLGASIYEQIGMLDLMLPFVFSLWCLVRLAQTNRGIFLAGIGILVVHCSIGYHLVMLTPLLALLGIGTFLFYRPQLLGLARALKQRPLGLATLAAGTILLFLSVLTATQEPGLLPMTRNLRYNSLVSENGTNLNHDVYGGRNLFDTARLQTGTEECHKSMHCSEYYVDYLTSFFAPDTRGNPISVEFTAFIGRSALLIALAGLFLGRRKLGWLFGLTAGFSFLLSLGTQTFVWPLTQRLFPLLGYVRHTHFYVCLFTLSLVGLFCVGAEWLEKKRRAFSWIAIVLIGEVLFFHFRQGVTVQMPLPSALRALVNAPLPDRMVEREARAFNPFTLPQTSVGSAYGRPTALEPVNVATSRPARDKGLDTFDIRFLGFVTPFMLRHTLRARLVLSEEPEAFKRAFGVRPYSILSLHPWKSVRYRDPNDPAELSKMAAGENHASKLLLPFAQKAEMKEPSAEFGIPIRIAGESLFATTHSLTPRLAYLAVPSSHIADILLDGNKAEFFKANIFGVALPLPAGAHTLEIKPNLETARAVFRYFYLGSFLLFLFLYLEYRRDRRHVPASLVGPAPEYHPLRPEVENLA